MWTKWNGIYKLLHHYLIYKLVCSVSLNKMKPYTELYTENKWKCDNCVSAMANILMFWCIISNILVSPVCFKHAYLLLTTDFNHVLYSRQNGVNLNLNYVDNHIWTSVSGNSCFKRWYCIDIYTTIHLKKIETYIQTIRKHTTSIAHIKLQKMNDDWITFNFTRKVRYVSQLFV